MIYTKKDALGNMGIPRPARTESQIEHIAFSKKWEDYC